MNYYETKDSTYVGSLRRFRLQHGAISAVVFFVGATQLIFAAYLGICFYDVTFGIDSGVLQGNFFASDAKVYTWIIPKPSSLVKPDLAIPCFALFLCLGIFNIVFSLCLMCFGIKKKSRYGSIFLGLFNILSILLLVCMCFGAQKWRLTAEDSNCAIKPDISKECILALDREEVFANDLCEKLDMWCHNEANLLYQLLIQSATTACFTLFGAICAFLYVGTISNFYRFKKKLYIKKNVMVNNNENNFQNSESDNLDSCKSIVPYCNNQPQVCYSQAAETTVPRSIQIFNSHRVNGCMPQLCLPPSVNHLSSIHLPNSFSDPHSCLPACTCHCGTNCHCASPCVINCCECSCNNITPHHFVEHCYI